MKNLAEVKATDFDSVYSILEEAFPLAERRCYQHQKALLDDPHYKIYGLYDSGLAAFLSQWEFDRFIFIEHYAVASRLRGKGVGSSFLKEYFILSEKKKILEVEPPETQTAKKRISFYQRLGFHLYDYPYEQPPMNAESGPLKLMVMSNGPLPPEEFAQFRKTVYQYVYQITL